MQESDYIKLDFIVCFRIKMIRFALGLQYIKDLCAPEYATVEIAVRSK